MIEPYKGEQHDFAFAVFSEANSGEVKDPKSIMNKVSETAPYSQ